MAGPGLVAFGLAPGPAIPSSKSKTHLMQTLLESDAPAASFPTTIKAISIWEPWASLIARGVKRHETRTWPTPYRGPIAIHAAKTLDLVGAPSRLCASALGYDWWADRPLGCIVAVAELEACDDAQKVARDITRADREAGDFGFGRFAWRMGHVRALAVPIPVAGRQGLWSWTPPADLEARLGPVRDHHEECRLIGWS